MREVVVLNALRKPIGNFGGSLKSLSSVKFASLVIKKILDDKGLRPKYGLAALCIGGGQGITTIFKLTEIYFF